MTANHPYRTPDEGTENWHVPLNENFEQLDTDVEIRDTADKRDSYEPKNGAKFLAIDTGATFVGDGNEWSRAPVQPHGHDKLRIPVKSSDPAEAAVGEIWYRGDQNAVKVQTTNGPAQLQVGSAESPDDGDGSDAEPDVSDAYTTIPFDSNDYTDAFTNLDSYGTRRIVDQTRSGSDLDRTALRVDLDQGDFWGTILKYDFTSEGHDEPEEIYARYHVYFPSGFEAGGTGGKLPGPAGPYGSTGQAGNAADGTNGWSARGAWRAADSSSDPRSVPIRPEYYVYHADMSGSYGDRPKWDVEFERDQWYQVDQHVKMNTPGQRDGVVEAWVDGEQVFDETYRFRNDGYDDIKIQKYWFTLTYGGSQTSPSDNSAYFSDLTLSPSPLL
ncbi:polysaccharide lyase [Halorussus amylolyticus]|uniref:polysaccharide lyase n=1 Tax=Halorussus amylolyticus TaxID=1126242 RepID=UPI00192F4BB8|nr:hypothetical protein [Halorussus amylolyticus]